MKFFAITMMMGCAFALAHGAAVSKSDEPIPILKESRDGPNPDGTYSYSYETANGIQAQEQGSLANNAISAKGSFSYTGEDGNPIQLNYVADENGFRPSGAHLPVAPEIPPAILRAIEYIAAHPEEDKLR